MELRELEEINHADPVTVQKRSSPFPLPRPRHIRLPPTFKPPPYKLPRRPTVPRGRRCPFCKPPPPPKAFPRNTPSH
ncbi:unnamed protein product [Arabidopsis arenosa]|uniref:Uncharacterized protein n=1 Tax=Arabidopsis arenosa TaxID=38785 RepID=A0A8S1ZJ85_ARAAE|nr:unnamed protein product [Arabidopsis arenosa]